MTLLRRHLKRSGFRPVRFPYSSNRTDLAQNGSDLSRFVDHLDAGVVHFVGHSLGGLVIVHMFAKQPSQRPGRIVLLGTPVAGSHAARRLARTRMGRCLLGKSLEQCLLGDAPVWAGGRDLGVIAGTLALGTGMLLGGLPRPSDGTVALSETHILGITDHIALPVTHTGLLLSAKVAAQVCAFLKRGHFLREAEGREEG